MSRLGPLVALLLLAAPSLAQVPSPETFFGYALGDRFTPHHRVVDYVTAVAETSDRVTLVPYGTTPQGRPLLALVVAAPGVDTEAVQASVQAAARGEGEPSHAVVWLSYSVHGNESVATEAALATLYDLATSARAAEWLRDVVVVLDPCLNPDGRDRYVHYYQNRRGMHPNADPDAWEHDEPWPGGRVNHYLFDLNRDWAWATQPETRQRLPLYNAWLPAVHVDFHEQGVDSPYYFAPGAEPFHPAITDWQRELQTRIGEANAALFDRTGRLYFTREVFDLFYPGYGDTWPTFNGSIGMTYEQGGSGRAGLAIVTAEGDTLTLADRIRGHMDTSLETIATTARDAAEVRQEFAAFFQQTPRDGVAAYAVWGSEATVDDLARLLEIQGIEYAYSTEAERLQGVRYGAGLGAPDAPASVSIPSGALVVPLDQPKRVLAQVLFEPNPALADSVTYDATAWALPYVYNLTAAALESIPQTTDGRLGRVIGRATREEPAGWIGRWESPADARTLAALLRAGVGVRILPDPVTIGGATYSRGAFVVTRAGNAHLGARLSEIVTEAGQVAGRPLVPLASGMIADGPDLGSNRVGFVRPPTVAVLTDDPVSPTALGEVWSLFDQRWEYPLTLLRAGSFSSRDLDDTDVLILPSGGYGSWLTASRAGALRDWVRGGGTLIAMERAATALARRDDFALSLRDDDGTDEDSTGARLRRYEDRTRESVSGDVPGSIFRVALDDSHPLAFGYPDWMYVFKRSVQPASFLEDDWNVGVLRDGAPVAGFAGTEAQARLEDSVVFAVEDLGRGHVVYLLDSPIFRGFWAGGELLMANAVFGLGTR
ncbi:MAG: M14 family metallopeptidase [Bacteroidota bacterium]